MTEGLLPCSKCGNEGAQVYHSVAGYFIECPECGTLLVGSDTTPLMAIVNYWNEEYLTSKEMLSKR